MSARLVSFGMLILSQSASETVVPRLYANPATCGCLTNINGELKTSKCTNDFTNLGTQSFFLEYRRYNQPCLVMGTSWDDELCVVADGAAGDKAYFKTCTEADSGEVIGLEQYDGRYFAHPSGLRLSIDDGDNLVLAEADDFDERQFFEGHPRSEAPHWLCEPTPSTPAHVQSMGLCADLPGGDTSDGKVLWMWECYNGENQEWIFNQGYILFGQSRIYKGLCVTNINGLVGLKPCSGSNFQSQLWQFNATTGAIFPMESSLNSPQCMQAGISQGDGITLQECNDEENQVWSVGPLSDVQRSPNVV